MRTIKFRGKRFDNGEWVVGDLLHIAGGCLIYFGSNTDTSEPDIEKSNPIAVEFFKDEIAVVDPDTVGQFTGLYDKNGKDIYEGDILKGRTNKWKMESKPAPYDFIGYVRWEGQCDVGLQWVLTTLDSVGSAPLNWYVNCVAIDYSTGVIIGNIHDNPELIKHPEL